MSEPALRIEGYVIVSADGMLADATHVMPDELKFEGDKRFFTTALDRADLIVHGRYSYEDQPTSPQRTRIVLTRTIDAPARWRRPHPIPELLCGIQRGPHSNRPVTARAFTRALRRSSAGATYST